MIGLTSVENSNFKEKVLQSELPALVAFCADRCGPCRALKPTLEKLATDYDGTILFLQINADENAETAIAYDVTDLPTAIIFKGGKAVQTLIGNRPESLIREQIDKLIA